MVAETALNVVQYPDAFEFNNFCQSVENGKGEVVPYDVKFFRAKVSNEKCIKILKLHAK